MGLHDSHHIGRVLIDPQNPDVVYVAVIGHNFSYNEQRGVYKTTDGGKPGKRAFISVTKLALSMLRWTLGTIIYYMRQPGTEAEKPGVIRFVEPVALFINPLTRDVPGKGLPTVLSQENM